MFHKVKSFIHSIHPYPFWVFMGFLMLSIVGFIACGVLCYFPHLVTPASKAFWIAEDLFKGAVGCLFCGCLLGPLMDLILKDNSCKKP